jgi:hypothetical protein
MRVSYALSVVLTVLLWGAYLLNASFCLKSSTEGHLKYSITSKAGKPPYDFYYVGAK